MIASRWTASTCTAALAALSLAAAPAAAQRATLRGQVIDSRSGQPVPHAAVYVDDNRTAALADAEGRFEVKHLRAGTRAIWADAPGYAMDLSMVELAADTTRVTLAMQSNPVQLEALRVTVSRFDRRARAYGGPVRVYREADLAGMWYSNVGQMVESRGQVQRAPCAGTYTLSFSYGCVASRGTVAASRVVVDEAPWMGDVRDLHDFPLADVSRVEIYGGGREVRVYTRQFMEWASRKPYTPAPLWFI